MSHVVAASDGEAAVAVSGSAENPRTASASAGTATWATSTLAPLVAATQRRASTGLRFQTRLLADTGCPVPNGSASPRIGRVCRYCPPFHRYRSRQTAPPDPPCPSQPAAPAVPMAPCVPVTPSAPSAPSAPPTGTVEIGWTVPLAM